MTKARHFMRRICGLALISAVPIAIICRMFSNGLEDGLKGLALAALGLIVILVPAFLGACLLLPMPPIGNADERNAKG